MNQVHGLRPLCTTCVWIRFGILGIKVLEVTGDNEHEAQELNQADIVCTTPEKLGAEMDGVV